MWNQFILLAPTCCNQISLNNCLHCCHALFVSVPAPTVVVTVPQGTHSVGTPLTITCDVSVNVAVVDTPVMGMVTWTGPGAIPKDTITGTIEDGTYQSSLEFNPLTSGDGGEYSCLATVIPDKSSISFVSESAEVIDSGILIVEGNYTKNESTKVPHARISEYSTRCIYCVCILFFGSICRRSTHFTDRRIPVRHMAYSVRARPHTVKHLPPTFAIENGRLKQGTTRCISLKNGF